MELATLVVTAVLALITAVYAWLTWLIAERTEKSASAAQEAAQSSRIAAEAALRSTSVAEASLPLKFEAEFDRHRDGQVWITVVPRGANAWLHSVDLIDGMVVPEEDGLGRRFEGPIPLAPPSLYSGGRQYPLQLFRDEGVSLDWPNPSLRAGDFGCSARLNLIYSVSREGERIARKVYCNLPHDLYERVNARVKLLLDKLPHEDSDK